MGRYAILAFPGVPALWRDAGPPPPKGREATRAHVKRQYGRWRQIVEPINDPLTRPFGQPCPGAWPAHGLLTRSAAKLAAGNLGLWLHHLCGRPALALTTLFPGS